MFAVELRVNLIGGVNGWRWLHCVELLLHKIFPIPYYASGCADISRFLSRVRRRQSLGKILTFFRVPEDSSNAATIRCIYSGVHFEIFIVWSVFIFAASAQWYFCSRCLFSRIRSMVGGRLAVARFSEVFLTLEWSSQPAVSKHQRSRSQTQLWRMTSLMLFINFIILYGFGLHIVPTFFYSWLGSDSL